MKCSEANDQCDPRPRGPEPDSAKADNCTDHQEDIAHHRQRHRENRATDQYQDLNCRRFRFLGRQRKPGLEKVHRQHLSTPACSRANRNAPQDCEIAGLSLLIVERFPTQRRKIRPSTNPIPSAVNTAFVGFSRTYCSASFSKRADAARGISASLFRFATCFAPGLFRFAAVFFRKSACG